MGLEEIRGSLETRGGKSKQRQTEWSTLSSYCKWESGMERLLNRSDWVINSALKSWGEEEKENTL